MKNTKYVLIESTVRRMLKKIQDSPERNFRNMVDFGLTAMKGRFIQQFLQTMQTMLQDDSSAYYSLVQDTVTNVDHDKLVGFGMNVGYNSCTQGAKTIRKIEREQNYNIPWSMALNIDESGLAEHTSDYDSLVSDGERLGIHTWILWVSDKVHKILPLIEQHPDSAFILCCSPDKLDRSTVSESAFFNNLMFAVRYGEDAANICEELRKNKALYSVYVPYSEKDIDFITSDEIFSCTEVLHPVFTILTAEPDCPVEAQKQIYDHITKARCEQRHKTIPWDAVYDNQYVDSVVSEDACTAYIDRKGYFISLCDRIVKEKYNVFTDNLQDILKMAFPKQQMV